MSRQDLEIETPIGILKVYTNYLVYKSQTVKLKNFKVPLDFDCTIKKHNVTVKIKYQNEKMTEEFFHNNVLHQTLSRNYNFNIVLGLLAKYKQNGFKSL